MIAPWHERRFCLFTTRVSGASRLPVPPASIKPFHEVTVWLPRPRPFAYRAVPARSPG